MGNHTYEHVNGWKVTDERYLADVAKAAVPIPSVLFRPPYGRLRSSQAKKLNNYKIVMWDVLSGDFDKGITSEKCLENVLRSAGPGSIIVFHDSPKALDKIKYVLPRVLAHFTDRGYLFKPLPQK